MNLEIHPPVSAPLVLEIQVCATTPGNVLNILTAINCTLYVGKCEHMSSISVQLLARNHGGSINS